jgi:hypothetical protein
MNVANTWNFEESANSSLTENVSPKLTSKGFSGEVLCHDISQIIRSLSLAKLDIALVIKNGPKDGKIIFKDGKIMASICGDLRDREAVSEIKSWKEGSFTLFRIFDGIVCRDD